jgi:predicted neuraminidase
VPPTPSFKAEPIFETLPSHPSVHAATITALPGDNLLVSFYAGTVEKAMDITIFQCRYDAESGTWSAPSVAVADENHSLGNPVLFPAPDGRLWLYYLVMHGEKWNTCTLHAHFSEDRGETWLGDVTFDDSLGWTTRTNPIVMDNDEILFPMCDEVKGYSFFLTSPDNGETWERHAPIKSNPHNLQPAVIQRENGDLLALIRTAGEGGRCWETVSRDHGRTWSNAKPGPFRNPNSALAMIKLTSGNIVAVYNNSDDRFYRTPLVISFSEDDGRTWPITRILEDQPGKFTYRTDRTDNWDSIEFSYPAITQTTDGMIHVVYTNDSRRNIKHAAVNEAWLKSGKLKE